VYRGITRILLAHCIPNEGPVARELGDAGLPGEEPSGCNACSRAAHVSVEVTPRGGEWVRAWGLGERGLKFGDCVEGLGGGVHIAHIPETDEPDRERERPS
jgi:hypothetical protein